MPDGRVEFEITADGRKAYASIDAITDELTAKILRLGYEIRETPIRYYPRKTSEGKKIRFRDGIQGFNYHDDWGSQKAPFFSFAVGR